MRPFRRALVSLVAVASALALQFGQSPAHVAPSNKHLRWILNGPALASFTSDPVALRFFADAGPFVLQRNGAAITIPPAWKSLPIRSFTNYAAMARAFATGAIGPEVRGILYDSEVWDFTPEDEQRRVADYTKKAADLVHSHGLVFLTAPAVNLVRKLDPSQAQAGAKRYDGYVKVRLAADSARYADVFVIQAQGSEADLAKYRSFVSAAAHQAREAKPNIIVLAGISTNPGGQKVDANIILAAIEGTRGSVDGYWFNVPAPGKYCPQCSEFRPDMALDVIRRLGR